MMMIIIIVILLTHRFAPFLQDDSTVGGMMVINQPLLPRIPRAGIRTVIHHLAPPWQLYTPNPISQSPWSFSVRFVRWTGRGLPGQRGSKVRTCSACVWLPYWPETFELGVYFLILVRGSVVRRPLQINLKANVYTVFGMCVLAYILPAPWDFFSAAQLSITLILWVLSLFYHKK